jgi:secreted PhoX family phosphatase
MLIKLTSMVDSPRNITDEAVQRYGAMFDRDGSNNLNLQEFINLMLFARKEFLATAFNAAAGAKGYCTHAEAEAALRAAGYDSIPQYIALADANNDGRIVWSEFMLKL